MQLALSVFSFALGFLLAGVVGSKPRQARAALDNLLRNVRHVLKALVPVSGEEDGAAALFEAEKSGRAELLTRAEVEARFGVDTWQHQAYKQIESILLPGAGAPKFPCIYATAGFRSNEHRYIFMHSEDPTEPRNIRLIASAMRAYLPLSHSLGPNTSLVIVHPTSDQKVTVHDYQSKFWEILRRLRTCDLKNWPDDIPEDTHAPHWAFCFDGVPWFPAAMTPAHTRRQSRHAPNFTIAMQPKWVFDNLFRTPERRRAAVDAVRKLMPAYDEIEPSPDLSAYGTEGTTEAHQYYLLDDNVTSECPFEDMDR